MPKRKEEEPRALGWRVISAILGRAEGGEASPDELKIVPDLITIAIDKYQREAFEDPAARTVPTNIVQMVKIPEEALLSIRQVEELIGKKRTWIWQRRRKEDFPEPVIENAREIKFRAKDIFKWKERYELAERERKAS